MINILEREEPLSGEELTQLERNGIKLIAVNCIKGFKWICVNGWDDHVRTVTWVYHFRTDRLPRRGMGPFHP